MALLTFGTRVSDDEREEEAYKTCPSCGSPVFNDMGVCYSCLFEWEGQLEDVLSRVPPDTLGGIPAAGGLPVLRVRTPYADFSAAVPEEGLTIGRSPSNAISIHSRTVEREHARISLARDGLSVELVDPAAKAWLDGLAIASCSAMAEGQILDIADASFICGPIGQGQSPDTKGGDA